MKISKFFKQQSLIFFAIIFLGLALTIANKITRPVLFIKKQDVSINVNSQFTNYFNLGQKRLLSSILWIATILESDHDHYKNKDLNSWMFLRFKTISDLEPLFYENYIFGGTYLSIIKDDIPGATYLYNKALKYYPDDFDLLKNSAYHFYFEVHDNKRAYQLYAKLRQHPKTSYVMLSTLARLESDNGKLDIAFQLLKGQYDKLTDKNGLLAKIILNHLYSIKAELDLTCLNSGSQGCATLDLNGDKYIFKNNLYMASKFWIPFRAK
jgi:hypothetical protein